MRPRKGSKTGNRKTANRKTAKQQNSKQENRKQPTHRRRAAIVKEGYKYLLVWQRGVEMSVAIYRLTAGFPREEIYGLSSQLRRAGVSVPSNIAEGWGRETVIDKKRFFTMARGSNMELQTQLVIAAELQCGEAASSVASTLSRIADRVGLPSANVHKPMRA